MTRRIPFTLSILAVLAAAALAQPSHNPAIAFNPVQTGVFLFDGSVNAGGKTLTLFAVRVALQGHRVEVGVAPGSKSGDTLIGFQGNAKAVAVLSGGFLKSFYPPIPLGLVKHNGTLMNRSVIADQFTGILLVRGNRLEIQRFGEGSCDSSWTDCLQSGPLLAKAGQPALPKPDEVKLKTTRAMIDGAYRRAFVAILPNRDIILGVTGPVSLQDLQEFLLRPADRGGLGCADALNLSGSTSAGLLTMAGGKPHSTGSTDVFLANSILVR